MSGAVVPEGVTGVASQAEAAGARDTAGGPRRRAGPSGGAAAAGETSASAVIRTQSRVRGEESGLAAGSGDTVQCGAGPAGIAVSSRREAGPTEWSWTAGSASSRLS